MKKILSIIIFFAVVGGIFYITKNMDSKNGVSFNELKKIFKIDKISGNKQAFLNNTKNRTEKPPKDEKDRNYLDKLKKQDILSGEKLSEVLNFGKKLQGETREIFNKILLENYKKDTPKFLEAVSNLKNSEMSNFYKGFLGKYIKKPKLLEDIENSLNSSNLTNAQRNNIKKLDKKINDQ